jgi:DivIVA domain-containing protein
MIDLTPLEVRKKKGDFRRAMRGYDPALVDDFLDLVADRLEELVRANLTLQERVTRQDEQVTDYRDRERALTEALVSAQEMREEVRKQAIREAELSTRSAQQHAEQLRAKVEEEVRQLRSSAQQEAANVLSSIQEERQREEASVRQLRARQQEFLSSYRAFLEEELAELGVIARAAGVTERAANSRGTRVAGPAAPPDAPPAAAQAVAREPETRQTRRGRPPAEAAADAGRPEGRTGSDHDEPAGGDDADERAARTPDGSAADVVDLDREPFEPEPFVDDESSVVAEAFDAEAATPLEGVADGLADETVVARDDAEARLYDAVAGDQDADGVPGPIGLGDSVSEPWSSAPEWTLPDLGIISGDVEGDDLDLDDDFLELDDDDEETSTLLRNAAAAGYNLDDDPLADEPLADELLLDEAVTDDDGESAPPAADSGWLPTLLEDDK